MLRALVDATPAPPEDADPETLLAAFAEMFEVRAGLLDGIDGILVATAEDRALAALLAERHVAWEGALARARAAVATHKLGARKLRGYAPAV